MSQHEINLKNYMKTAAGIMQYELTNLDNSFAYRLTENGTQRIWEPYDNYNDLMDLVEFCLEKKIITNFTITSNTVTFTKNFTVHYNFELVGRQRIKFIFERLIEYIEKINEK